MKLERYYYSSDTIEYLTPMRAYDICRADLEGIPISQFLFNDIAFYKKPISKLQSVTWHRDHTASTATQNK